MDGFSKAADGSHNLDGIPVQRVRPRRGPAGLRWDAANFRARYVPAVRVTCDAMPDHCRWHYVEAPPAMAETMLGLPTSRHKHGVIAVSRPLSEDERKAAQLTPEDEADAVPVEPHSAEVLALTR